MMQPKCLTVEKTRNFRLLSNKKKIIHVDLKKITNYFENLSNELFYEIFDYLEGYKLYKAFSNLNSRFQALLACSSLRLKIDLRFYSEGTLEYCANSIIAPNKDRIISLSLANNILYQLNFTIFNIDATFNRLESLVLESIKSNELIPLLISLISLPRLSSLEIYYNEDSKELSNIYQIVFNFPMLNYYKLSLFVAEASYPLSIATNEQFSTIKYLIIDHCCSFDELITILSYTPQLCRLTCEQVNESDDNIVEDALKMICSLKRVSFAKFYAEFDELEMFLRKVSPHLEVLCFNSCNDVTYLDANQWERIISKYLSHLNKLEFKYEESIDEELVTTIYHENLNEFKSLFWIKRQWFFKIAIDTDFWDNNIIVYTIHSYSKDGDIFEKYNGNDQSFINDISHNMIEKSIAPDQQESSTSSTMISESNHLNIIDLSYFQPNETYYDMLSPILTNLSITCLNITLSTIFIGTLIDFIRCLPNLDSLVISSLEMLQPRCLSIEETRNFRLLSDNNKITKVNLKQMNDLEEVQFFLDLCPRMTYFEVNCTDYVGPENVLRFILMKNIRYIRNLSLLCLKVSRTNLNIVDNLKHTIDFEQLCHNYTIKQIDNRIYLRLT
ncbi:unnamed protein product [Rotaria sp. Silwood2]|nr:unnamed protein product [Rotaria sp. Silwood2]